MQKLSIFHLQSGTSCFEAVTGDHFRSTLQAVVRLTSGQAKKQCTKWWCTAATSIQWRKSEKTIRTHPASSDHSKRFGTCPRTQHNVHISYPNYLVIPHMFYPTTARSNFHVGMHWPWHKFVLNAGMTSFSSSQGMSQRCLSRCL